MISARLAPDFTALASAANLAVVAGYLDTEIAAIKAKTDALPVAPAAVGDIPTAAAVADAVWDEILSGHAGVRLDRRSPGGRRRQRRPVEHGAAWCVRRRDCRADRRRLHRCCDLRDFWWRPGRGRRARRGWPGERKSRYPARRHRHRHGRDRRGRRRPYRASPRRPT